MLCRPADPLPRNYMPRDDIKVAASGGDDGRAPEGAPEQDCRRAVRVEIVCIYQVEIRSKSRPSAICRRSSGRAAAKRQSGAALIPILGSIG